jgi:hypothetical protein
MYLLFSIPPTTIKLSTESRISLLPSFISSIDYSFVTSFIKHSSFGMVVDRRAFLIE